MADATQYSLGAIEAELATAVDREKRRVATDEMKKRAILTAPSYDDFKNLVAAAHQKPVDQKDMQVLQGAAVQQFPPIHNKAATSVRTSGARSGLGRRRRAPAPAATTEATPATSSPITSLRSFESEWGKCAGASERQRLLREVPPATWGGWAAKHADTVDGACVAAVMGEAAALPPQGCVDWCCACVGCFKGPALAVWGGTLTPAQRSAARAALLQAAEAAQGEQKQLLHDAMIGLHWNDSS